MIGGSNGEHELTVLERFDPRTGTTDLLQPMPTSRESLSAAVFDNKIYVVGGKRCDATESWQSQSLDIVEM